LRQCENGLGVEVDEGAARRETGTREKNKTIKNPVRSGKRLDKKVRRGAHPGAPETHIGRKARGPSTRLDAEKRGGAAKDVLRKHSVKPAV